ncbi:YraN family protein [Thermocrinis sp.]|uniref:YraN family protein n=1 Tax=Thermocrinis sp. TaxID=2024383 RepID=UPI00260CF6C0|nr:YraN family protein [Thermocrinis sp.]
MKKGKSFEDIACEYLTSLGYRILHRNFYCRGGEIDIIALDGEVLVFVEVKGTATKLNPAERINHKKLQRIYKCAEEFLSKAPARECRVDAILVEGSSIVHLKNISL